MRAEQKPHRRFHTRFPCPLRAFNPQLQVQGPPYKLALRVLAEKYLRRRIQQGQHDSVVDARTALDLARLKFRHGPAFGVEPLVSGDRLMDVLAAANRSATLVRSPFDSLIC